MRPVNESPYQSPVEAESETPKDVQKGFPWRILPTLVYAIASLASFGFFAWFAVVVVVRAFEYLASGNTIFDLLTLYATNEAIQQCFWLMLKSVFASLYTAWISHLFWKRRYAFAVPAAIVYHTLMNLSN